MFSKTILTGDNIRLKMELRLMAAHCVPLMSAISLKLTFLYKIKSKLALISCGSVTSAVMTRDSVPASADIAFCCTSIRKRSCCNHNQQPLEFRITSKHTHTHAHAHAHTRTHKHNYTPTHGRPHVSRSTR